MGVGDRGVFIYMVSGRLMSRYLDSYVVFSYLAV